MDGLPAHQATTTGRADREGFKDAVGEIGKVKGGGGALQKRELWKSQKRTSRRQIVPPKQVVTYVHGTTSEKHTKTFAYTVQLLRNTPTHEQKHKGVGGTLALPCVFLRKTQGSVSA